MHRSSMDELTGLLEQVDYQIRFLALLVYRLVQKCESKPDGTIRILRTASEIANYIYEEEADCVMLTSPEIMPVLLKSKDMGWIQDTDDFADWLMVNWNSEMMVIAIP